MNFLLFDNIQSSIFNGNFISIYNTELGRFKYYIQNLAGVTMENENEPENGKLWVVYINNFNFQWDDICEKEITVKTQDQIYFKYE
jgi:hypothetical protein